MLRQAIVCRMKQTKLGTIFLNHFKGCVVFTLANAPSFGLGVSLFYYETSGLDQNKYAMHWANVLPMAVITFGVNRMLPRWRKRRVQQWDGLRKWAVFSGKKTLASQALFATFVSIGGLPAVPVSAGATLVLGLASYYWNEHRIFPRVNGEAAIA